MRNQIWAGGVLAFILSGVAAGSARAEGGTALLKEAQELADKASRWKSYKTHFALDAKEEDGKPFLLRGTLAYKRPGLRRLEIREGETADDKNTQLLISDGEVEWQYYPQNNVVYKIKNPPESPGPHRPFTEVKPETVRFVKKTQGEGGALLEFEAEPQPATVQGSPVPIKKVRLEVAEKDGMLREMVMLDEKGETVLTQRFTDLEVEPALSDGQFKFTPPQGTQVTELPPAPAEEPKKP